MTRVRIETRRAASALCFALALASLPMSSLAATNDRLAGSPMVYAIDEHGWIRERDRMGNGDAVTDSDTVTVTLNTLYLKYIKADFGLRGNELLVYAEVFDSPTDTEPYRTVVFNERHQSQDSVLGVVDRVIYGPTTFKGYPLRIRLFVVELDKKDNESTKAMVNAMGRIVSAAQPAASPFVGLGLGIGDILTSLNDDDFELRSDITLHPQSLPKAPIVVAPATVLDRQDRLPLSANLINMPLTEGQFVLFKAEFSERKGVSDLSTQREFLAASDFYYEDRDPEFPCYGTTRYVLMLKSGYLWLDEVCEDDMGSWSDSESMEFYDEKTYAVFAVRRGGTAAVDTAIKEALQSQWDAVKGQLQTTNDDDLIKAFQEAGARTAGDIDASRALSEINADVGRDPTLRSDPQYAHLLINRLVREENADPAKRLHDERMNAALLKAIRSTVLGFPALEPDDFVGIKDAWAKSSEEGRICSAGHGFFRWSTADAPEPCKAP